MSIFRDILAGILFWKYYCEKKSYQRELKIYFCYKNLLISSFILAVASWLLALLLYTATKNYFPFSAMQEFQENAAVIFCMLFGINFLAARSAGEPIFDRVFQIKFNALFFKIESRLLTDLFHALDEADDRDLHKNKNGQSATAQEIKEILMKFELPEHTSDFSVVKKRFKELAVRYHPDHPPFGDSDVFKSIYRDYELIRKYYQLQKTS